MPERVAFEHRLVGLEDRWRRGNPDRVAYYNHLKPGNYRFEVRAANLNGVWSPDVTALALTLRPHFWQTRLFLGLCVLTGLGVVAALQAYRLRFQRRILLLQQQHALELERTRIARDMHDRLGANLSRLALTANESGVSQTQVRETLRELKDLIWSVSPKNDTLASLADFMANAAQQYLEAAGIELELEWPKSLPRAEVPGGDRQHLVAAYQEALRNIVQHAQATEVRIALSGTEELFVVDIVDNGRGFAADSSKSVGSGLRHLRTRLEEIGGRCEIDSRPGEGTKLRFHVPIRPGEPR